MRITLCFLTILFCVSYSAAQNKLPVKHVVRAAQQAERAGVSSLTYQSAKSIGRQVTTGPLILQRNSAALADAMRVAAEKAVLSAQNEQMLQTIRRAVFPAWGEGVAASGFFLEEIYEGKRFVWAVVPAHLAQRQGELISIYLAGPDGKAVEYLLVADIVGSGGYSNWDIALLRVPKELAGSVSALKLAGRRTEPGAEVASFGFNGVQTNVPQMNAVWARKVLKTAGSSIKTTYNFGEQESVGACGSPVLNEWGQVVGVHCGSASTNASFAVDAPVVIRALLREYRHPGTVTRLVKINGREMVRLEPNQRVSRVVINRPNQKRKEIPLNNYAEPIDFEQLEKTLPILPGDRVELYITRQGDRKNQTRVAGVVW